MARASSNDAERTVAEDKDKRLGDIDVVLLSHVHGDHLGDRRVSTVNAGGCSKPEANDNDNATPASNIEDNYRTQSLS